MYLSSDDEIDIVSDGEVDDNIEEPNLSIPMPTIFTKPIAEWVGISRLNWMDLEVVLFNDNGIPVAKGVCPSTHSQHCVDKNSLGKVDVGVVILETLIHANVNPTHRLSL